MQFKLVDNLVYNEDDYLIDSLNNHNEYDMWLRMHGELLNPYVTEDFRYVENWLSLFSGDAADIADLLYVEKFADLSHFIALRELRKGTINRNKVNTLLIYLQLKQQGKI